MLSAHQAKYFAYELTKRCPSESVEKFSATLMDAQVDYNYGQRRFFLAPQSHYFQIRNETSPPKHSLSLPPYKAKPLHDDSIRKI